MSNIKKRVFRLELDSHQMCLLRNALMYYSSYLTEECLSSSARKVDDLYIIVMNNLNNLKL